MVHPTSRSRLHRSQPHFRSLLGTLIIKFCLRSFYTLQTMVECLFGVCTPYLLMNSFLIRGGPPFLFCDHRIERAKHASHLDPP